MKMTNVGNFVRSEEIGLKKKRKVCEVPKSTLKRYLTARRQIERS